MLLNNKSAKLENITIKVQKIIEHFEIEQKIEDILFQNNLLDSVDKIKELLFVYFNNTNIQLRHKIYVLLTKIGNSFPYTKESILEFFVNNDDVNTLKVLKLSDDAYHFMRENIEILKSKLYDINKDLRVDDNEEQNSLETCRDKLENLIGSIYTAAIFRVYKHIGNTSLKYCYTFDRCHEGDYFNLKFQMETRYTVIPYSNWLGGDNRNVKLDDLYSSICLNDLYEESSFYCYEDAHEGIGFVKHLREDSNGYEISVEGRGSTRIVFTKLVNIDDIDDIKSFTSELISEINCFSEKYDDFIQFLTDMFDGKRQDFDDVIGDTFPKYENIIKGIDNLGEVITELCNNNKKMMDYLIEEELI